MSLHARLVPDWSAYEVKQVGIVWGDEAVASFGSTGGK
jgi:hypothetical protein